MLHTLQEMRVRVQRLLADAEGDQWNDSSVVDGALRRGFEFTVSALVRDSAARGILLRHSAPSALSAGCDVYAAPSDSLGVARVLHRPGTGRDAALACGAAGESDFSAWEAVTDGSLGLYSDDALWRITGIDFSGIDGMAAAAAAIQAAIRAATGGAEVCEWNAAESRFELQAYTRIGALESAAAPAGTDISGSAWMNGQSDAATFTVSARTAWSVVAEARTGGGPAAGGNGLSSAAAVFFGGGGVSGLGRWRRAELGDHVLIEPCPRRADGLLQFVYLAEPGWPESDAERIHFMPRQFDACLEYFAASDLSNEEVHDGVPIGAFGNLWRNTFVSMTGGRVHRRLRSGRQSIRRMA